MKRQLFLLAAVALISGCAQTGNKSLALDTVRTGGSYALYAKDNQQPIIIRSLHQGDKIGFEYAPDGKQQTAAISGSHKDQLAPGHEYRWERFDPMSQFHTP